MSESMRVEKCVMKKDDPFYSMIRDFCHNAKNLYNYGNYLVRQEFINNGKWLRYGQLDKILRPDEEYPDYKNMPTAQSAQQLLRALDNNWKSFFESNKDYKKNPSKYSGRPKLPKYLEKKGYYVLTLTNQEARLREGVITFPKAFNGYEIKPTFTKREDFISFQQVRFVPKRDEIIVELVYKIKDKEVLPDNGNAIGIDIGVNNLAAVCCRSGKDAFILNGRPLKSFNQFYNKQAAYYKSVAMTINKKRSTKRLRKLGAKRDRQIEDYLHKASRHIINYCVKNNINTIVIGKNKEWKKESKFSKKENQNFVQIPFARFIEMIEYKAKELGIVVILQEESYTSGTSFIDNEEPTKANYNKKRRVKRGLFVSNNGTTINADLNGAYQILKKVFPIEWDSGRVLHPEVVTLERGKWTSKT